MNQTLKKNWNIISSILVSLVVILALLLAGSRLIGLRVFTVLSGSMEPTYHTGSLIYVKKTDAAAIEPGQVITFMLDEDTIATHRVVEVVPDETDSSVLRFRTKGDANEVEDGGLVHYKNVIGTPIFTIPYLGYLADYIQHPPGLYVAFSAGAILLLLVFLPDVFAADKDKTAKTQRRKKTTPVPAGGPSAGEAAPNRQLLFEAEKLLTPEEMEVIRRRMDERPLSAEEETVIRELLLQRREALVHTGEAHSQ